MRHARLPVTLVLLAAGCAAAPPPAPAALGPGTYEPIAEVEFTRRAWRFGRAEGQVIVTAHHRLHTTVTDPALLDVLPLFLERSLAHYASALGPLPQPRERLESYLFAERSQWEAKTRQMLSRQAPDFLTLGRGGFTTRGTSVLYDIGRRDTLAIAAHEGWHQYAQRTFHDALPVWLEEGVATYMEGFIRHPDGIPKFRPWANLERYHALRAGASRDRLIPLPQLLQSRPEEFLKSGKQRLLLYYAQVWALVHFLAEGEEGRYRAGLEEVLSDAARGRSERYRRAAATRPGPGVVLGYLTDDLEGFEAQYAAFVERSTRTGGRGRIVRGESPLER